MSDQDIRSIFLIQAETRGIRAAREQLDALHTSISKLPRDGKVQVSVTGTSAAVMERRADAVRKYGNELQRIKAMGPVNAGVNARSVSSVNAATTSTRALRKELTGVERIASRTASRLEFLATAVIAGLLIDSLSQATGEAAALEGRQRALDVGFTRTGRSGRQYYEILRTTSAETRRLTAETDQLRFNAKASSDALAKIMVGGMDVDRGRMERMKLMSTGAGALFGEAPSQMMTDLTTAWLRQSYKLADNLGLVVRRMDAYKKMADELGVSPNDLTADQKAEAFGREMLESAGADLLIMASQIETPLIQLENAKERLDTFRLTLGQVVLEGLIPTIDRLGDMSDEQLEATARTVMLTAKTGLWLVGLQQAASLLGRLKAGMAGYGQTLMAGAAASHWLRGSDQVLGGFARVEQKYGSLNAAETKLLSDHLAVRQEMQVRKQRGLLLARNTALVAGLTAALALAAAAQNSYNRRMAAANELSANLAANTLKQTQFLASIGLEAERAASPVDALSQKLIGLEIDGQVKRQLLDTVGSMQTYSEELANNADRMGLSAERAAELKGEVSALTSEGLNAYITAVQDAAFGNAEYGLSLETIALIATGTYVPSMYAAQRAVEDAQLAQVQALADGQNSWDEFMNHVRYAILGLIDIVAEGVMKIGSVLAIGLGASIAGTLEAILLPLNAFISGVNASIESVNSRFGTNWGTIKGLTIPGLNVTVGGGLGSSWFSMFGGANTDATQQLLGNILSAEGSDGKFGFGLYEGALLQQAAPAMSAYARLAETTSKQAGPLGYKPPGRDDDLGAKAGGGSSKQNRDPYEVAVERLETKLSELDSSIKYHGFNPDKVADLEKSRDKALVEFLIDADAAGWLGQVAGDPELQAQIDAAYERYSAGSDELAVESAEAVEKVNENNRLAQRELEFRESLGLEVDKGAQAQEALAEYIDLAARYGLEVADQYEGAAQAAEGLKAAIRERREEAAALRLHFDLDQLDYLGSLAAAREPDANRRIGVQTNTLLDTLDRQLREADRVLEVFGSGSREAYETTQTLQDLHVELETMVRNLDHEGLFTGSGKEQMDAILLDVQQRVESQLSALDAGAYVTAEEQLVGNTTALDTNTEAINQLTVTLGGQVPPAKAGVSSAAAVEARKRFEVIDGQSSYAALEGSSYSFPTGRQRIWVPDECTGSS